MFKYERGLALGQLDCRIFTSAISQEGIDELAEFLHGDINPENVKVELTLWRMWSKICCLKTNVSYTGTIF